MEAWRTDPDWVLQHAGEDTHDRGAVTPPVYQTSLFVFDSAEQLVGLLSEPSDDAPVYSRVQNPNTRIVETKLAALEGTDDARVFGSGMAAISAAIMATVEAGSHVVAVDTIYGPSKGFLSSYLQKFGVTVDWVDGLTPESVIDALRPETSLVYLESPSSLVFRLQDLPTITAETRRRGITTLIDNTYSTPLYQQPASMGVDLIVHSASKYLGGHSDIVAGALCGDAGRIGRIVANELQYFGGILHPWPAWLMMRGMRTLRVRLEAHEKAGNDVAAFLMQHPDVAKVNHPGAHHPQANLFRSQMKGSGGLLSFETKRQDREYVLALTNACQLFQKGVSWGGFESLIIPSLLQPMGYEQPTWVIRLFCGLEGSRTQIQDLSAAFEAASGV